MGFGCCTLTQSTINIIFSWLFGVVTEKRTVASFDNSLLIIIALAITGLLLEIWLLKVDKSMGSILQLPENDEKVKALSKSIDKKFLAKIHSNISKYSTKSDLISHGVSTKQVAVNIEMTPCTTKKRKNSAAEQCDNLKKQIKD